MADMNSNYESIRIACLDIVRAAGQLARERMHDAQASRKADRSVVTDVDMAVQELLQGYIAREHPGDAVIAEEVQAAPGVHASAGEARRCWVIDPIDGTRNYVRKVPMFTVVLALLEAGSPVVGIIYNPMTDSMYSASLGGGMFVDDRPARVAPAGGAEILISLPSGREEPLPEAAHAWINTMILRSTGSTALNMALVASGAIDACIATKVRLWDMAAGVLLIHEAGGTACDHHGRLHFPIDAGSYRDQRMPFVASRPDLMGRLLADLDRGQVVGDR